MLRTFQIADCGLEDDKPDGFSITAWLKRETKRENRKNLVFKIALKKARNGNIRAGIYLKKKYGIVALGSGEHIFTF